MGHDFEIHLPKNKILVLGLLSTRSLSQAQADCGSEHFLCPDNKTCCDLGYKCCPDPTTNTGTGCCDIANVRFRVDIIIV